WIDYPVRPPEPFLPAVRADPRFNVRAERAGKPYLPGALTLLSASGTKDDRHQVILQMTSPNPADPADGTVPEERAAEHIGEPYGPECPAIGALLGPVPEHFAAPGRDLRHPL